MRSKQCFTASFTLNSIDDDDDNIDEFYDDVMVMMIMIYMS